MHKPTPVLMDNKARQKILKGVNTIYEAVRRTMGPQGGNVLMYGLYSRPYRLTNDGYTVADIISIKDPHEKLAAAAVQDAAKRTNLLAGDGTTCTTVLTGAMLNAIFPSIMNIDETAVLERAIESDIKATVKRRGVMDIKRDLLKTRDVVVEKLKKMSKPIKSLEDLEKIAIASIEDEAYGKTVAEMAYKVGANGYLDVVEGFGGKIETEVIEGARTPAKIPAKVFVNKPERYEMEQVDTNIVLTNYVIDGQTVVELVTKVQSAGLKRLTIISPNFTTEALVMLAKANEKVQAFAYAPIKVPSLKTAQFEDLAVVLGARFINKDRGDKIADFTANDLGFAAKIVVKDADVREDAIILGGAGTHNIQSVDKDGNTVYSAESPVVERIKMLTEQLKTTRESGKKELLKRRIAGLGSAVGVIRVSCDSEAETYYWKKKFEDAVYACKAALEEGYIVGGGIALKKIAEKLPKDNLIRESLMAPYNQIQENAEGIEIDESVIDPTKAIRCAVEHAVSVVANLATVKVIIPEERDKSPVEGYEAIAVALNQKNMLWARHEGIIQENEEEIYRDQMAHHDAVIRSIVD